MTGLEERLEGLVRDSVVPVLKPRGYRKKRLTWIQETSDAVREVSLQRSHGNAAAHLRVYVEVAAYVPAFDRVLGKEVPAALASATASASAQYRHRFEDVIEWPGQWIDLEAWSDDDLIPRFRDAVVALADHLDAIDSAESLVAAKRAADGDLDLALFAWSCATGDAAERDAQLARALATYGDEERWPRLRAQFDKVAERYGVELPA